MYNVVILAEQAMTAGDAQEVVSLHENIEDTRHYHVLIPCDSAADRAELALGTIAAHESLAAMPVLPEDNGIEAAQRQIDSEAGDAVSRSVEAIRGLGVEASGEFSSMDPVDKLAEVVTAENAAEVIVMTLPHSISPSCSTARLDVTGATPPRGAAAPSARARVARGRGRLRTGHHRDVTSPDPGCHVRPIPDVTFADLVNRVLERLVSRQLQQRRSLTGHRSELLPSRGRSH